MKPAIFKNNSEGRQGFTLIELMVTIAVLAIVMVMAVPSFNNMIDSSRSSGLASELTAAVNFARSEAIKRVQRVTICPSANGTSCLTSSDWARGWLVFVDRAASDSAAPVMGTEPIYLKYWDRLGARTVASLKSVNSNNTSSTAMDFLRFNSRGMLARSGVSDPGLREFELHIAGCKGNARQVIRVGLAGMVTTRKTACP